MRDTYRLTVKCDFLAADHLEVVTHTHIHTLER